MRLQSRLQRLLEKAKLWLHEVLRRKLVHINENSPGTKTIGLSAGFEDETDEAQLTCTYYTQSLLWADSLETGQAKYEWKRPFLRLLVTQECPFRPTMLTGFLESELS